MARPKKGTKDNPVSSKEMQAVLSGEALVEGRSYLIKGATLKDGYCDYVYEVTKGGSRGEKHRVEGPGLYEDDLRFSFGKLSVHMAAIDDVFKHSGIEIDDINNYHASEQAHLFSVSGFKVSGAEGDESVVLIGAKYVSCSGGRIEIKTPKIPIDNMSSYPWYLQLREAINVALEEVALYKEGKYVIEDDEDEPNAMQMTIDQQIESNEGHDDGEGDNDDDFEEYLHK